MDAGGEQQAAVAELLTRVPAHELLSHVVDALLAEDPTGMVGVAAFTRAGVLLGEVDRVRLAVLGAVRDVDCRQLFTHADAGSTRGWLRRLPGGDDGQLARARQLAAHPRVGAAVADGSVSVRSAGVVCDALGLVPADLDDATTTAFLIDGVGGMLAHAGGTRACDPADTALLTGCAANTTVGPADRVQPALVLLARRLTPNLLGRALGHLLDAIKSEPDPEPDVLRYYLHLSPLPSGDWDLRGVLDPETGQLLADELARRDHATRTTHTADDSTGADADTAGAATDADAATDTAEPDAGDADDSGDAGAATAGADDPAGGGDTGVTSGAGAADESGQVLDFPVPGSDGGETAGSCTHQPGGNHPDHPAPARRCPRCAPRAFIPAGRRRHDTLTDLLRDTATRDTRPGQAVPTALTVTTTLEALTGRPGAPPGLLHYPGHPPLPLPTETLHRLACNAALSAVILDAHRNPVGASHTARSATPRERRTLNAIWGPHCAVHGCAATATVPHHVHPYAHSKETVLRDLVPLCHHCHLDIHEGRRTITLRNGRRINDAGWATNTNQEAA